MELFAAGNETQLQTIKRWIDGCDVYMLLLGGRYGSIEPKSKLSYTEVEYKYALDKKKPLFAIVMSNALLDDKLKQMGSAAIDRDKKFLKFKKLVESYTVDFFDNNDQIINKVARAIRSIEETNDLVGWVRGDSVQDSKILIRQIDSLQEENKQLKAEVKTLARKSENVSKSKRPIKQFEFEGGVYAVNHWRDMLMKVLFLLAESKRLNETDLFALNGSKKPFFTYDERKMSRPVKIPLTNLYIETHHSPDSFKRLTKAVISAVGLSDSAFRILAVIPRD